MSEIPFKKIESDRGGICHCSRRPEIPPGTFILKKLI
jgi:hypothetical protein